MSEARQRVGGCFKTLAAYRKNASKTFVYSGMRGTACMLECILKALACRRLRDGLSKLRDWNFQARMTVSVDVFGYVYIYISISIYIYIFFFFSFCFFVFFFGGGEGGREAFKEVAGRSVLIEIEGGGGVIRGGGGGGGGKGAKGMSVGRGG